MVHRVHRISILFPLVTIEVCDDDGQFLLIHTAPHLSEWVQPQLMHNRV